MTTNAGESRRPRNVRQQNVSLFPPEWQALRVLADDERNGNISAAVARMIAAEMASRHGDDWRGKLPKLLQARGLESAAA